MKPGPCSPPSWALVAPRSAFTLARHARASPVGHPEGRKPYWRHYMGLALRQPHVLDSRLFDLDPSAVAVIAVATAGFAPTILLAFLPLPVIALDAELEARFVPGLAGDFPA